MSRYTLIYSGFVSRLDEVHLLRTKAAALSRIPAAIRHGPEISALCRAAVVLLSSHIEAYVKELGELTLDSVYGAKVCRSKIAPLFFYHMSKGHIENIRSGSDPEKIAANVQSFVQSESTMWNSTSEFPRPISISDFNAGFSNPKFNKVKSYFARFGYEKYRRDLFHELGALSNITIAKLDQIVETRNSIAHGDPSATKTPVEVADMIATAKLFCRATDSVFASWCSSNLCSIRQ